MHLPVRGTTTKVTDLRASSLQSSALALIQRRGCCHTVGWVLNRTHPTLRGNTHLNVHETANETEQRGRKRLPGKLFSGLLLEAGLTQISSPAPSQVDNVLCMVCTRGDAARVRLSHCS
ncbi:hypothetical protein SRHO_G00238670 [Serrasalmus rhombeus]